MKCLPIKIDYYYKNETFERFISDQPELDVEIAKKFLLKSGGKILLVLSELGNGGTHLMSAIANRVVQNQEQFVAISSEYFLKVFNENKDLIFLEQYIYTCNYLFVDDVELIHRTSNLAFIRFKRIIDHFIWSGKKVVFTTQTEHKKTILELFPYTPIEIAQTKMPYYETLLKIARLRYPPEIIKAHAAKAYVELNSVMEFLGYLCSKEAAKKLYALYPYFNKES